MKKTTFVLFILGSILLSFAIYVTPVQAAACTEVCMPAMECTGNGGSIVGGSCGAGNVCCDFGGGAFADLTTSDVLLIVRNLGDWVFVFGLAIAVIMLLVGGIMFVTGGGDPTRIATAKKLILWTVIGLVFILFARGILTVVLSLLGA